MNKCPSCRSVNLTFIDSSENIQYEIPGSKHEFSKWEEYECQDCGALLMVENGYISVRRYINSEYKTVMRYSVNWEKVLEEVLND
jgi:hypothetical protein